MVCTGTKAPLRNISGNSGSRGLGVFDVQRDEREGPGQREGEREHQQDSADDREGAVVEPEAGGHSDDEDEEHDG